MATVARSPSSAAGDQPDLYGTGCNMDVLQLNTVKIERKEGDGGH
jgi:hypothetical protein